MSSGASLGDEVDRINGNVNGLFEKVSALEERVDDLEDELAEERAKREAAEDLARRALGVARALDDGARADGSPKKIDVARRLSRNETVRQVATSGTGGSVTAAKVQNMAKPETNLYRRTIFDAWDDLVEKWRGFDVEELGDDHDANKRLVAHGDALEDDVVGVVEEDLSRDDLAERLHSGGR